MSHARLRLRHQVPEGLHRLSLLLRDSGQPPQQREQPLNVTVCRCAQDGVCLPGAAARHAGGAGVSLGALVIMLASIVLLLRECLHADVCCPRAAPGAQPRLSLTSSRWLSLLPPQCLPCRWPSSHGPGGRLRTRDFCTGHRMTSGTTSSTTTNREAEKRTRLGGWWGRWWEGSLEGWGDTHTVQEEVPPAGPQVLLGLRPQHPSPPARCLGRKAHPVIDPGCAPPLRPQDAYDINQLRHPAELAALRDPLGRPPLRRDAPLSRVRPQPPRLLPTSPADIADFINDVGAPRRSARGAGPQGHTHPH